ncbi:MAG: glycosyltransferase family 9 protein [Desulfovibrionaceae bacterium]|nr:glycosyltransferase family 9 protein [Desulfovibrionaceae bacterium]
MTDPILIVQMQRMGDLILSFPLIVDRMLAEPKTPIWLVAEEIFYAPLLRLAPPVTFFPPSHLPQLVQKPFSCVINISSRPEAARFLGEVRADIKLGPLATEGAHRVNGFWHLYRHSLTQNNRHNTFHWADLNRLDLYRHIRDIPQRGHRIRAKQSRRIGLVLGASESSKHPDVSFWTLLAKTLVRCGYLPFLFGGPGEAAMGEAVARAAGIPGANLCGKLSVDDLAAWFSTLALCISPDTGPMHLADWLSVPVLNLSMGPVRALETGPYSQGQWILKPAMSCAGCWQCDEKKFRCKKKFRATKVAHCALALLSESQCDPKPSLTLLKSARSDKLYTADYGREQNCQTILDRVQRRLFLSLWEGTSSADVPDLTDLTELMDLARTHPRLIALMEKHLDLLCAKVLLATRGIQKAIAHGLFLRTMPALRLFTGFLESYLQNYDMSPKSLDTVCTWLVWFRDSLRIVLSSSTPPT